MGTPEDSLEKLRRYAAANLEKAAAAEGRSCMADGCSCEGFVQYRDSWGGAVYHGDVCTCGHPLAHHLVPRD